MTAQILIAGVSSGVGKTTITLGLIAALRRRGLRVQPFKAGPDYIDPTYHTLAAGRPCRNIDTWMVPPDRALELYDRASQTTDMAVIEGVMGVFDGYNYSDEEGSTAQIAKLVGAPVLLVLDVGKMARSAAALARGYAQFDPDLKLAGFILNRCGSESHYMGVKQAVENATGLPVLGWLPKNAELHIPERHLGLVPTDERGELSGFIARAADLIEQYFEVEQIIVKAEGRGARRKDEIFSLSNFSSSSNEGVQSKALDSRVVIAVARDAAFSFYYEDNLSFLRESGAEVVFFSPQHDAALPEGTAGLYFGGGFPEIYARQLAANKPLLAALRQAHAAGMPIYAECGGFMYLTEGIIDLEGEFHPLVGLIPGITRMQPRLVSLGYRLVESPPGGNFLLPPGVTTRGHEFHWSTWEVKDEGGRMKDERSDISSFILHPSSFISPAWHIRPRQGDGESQPTGYAHGNLVASYVHLHFGHNPDLAYNFAQACRQWLDSR
ncbi:MAG: cobyrinic acid a,c-diamide synthase [Anaerolineae bacterium]|nr:cobyrinate a,c-diamide synthase [Anaerolineales bacterium]MCQ3977189.1 cobyrinic acid a,c-diamide synthase [Anaerolineae bacterium]